MTTWQWVGLVCMAIIVLLIVVRMAQASVREFARQLEQKKMCDDHCCNYYREYLQKGPADISHSQYHEAVNSFHYWKEREGRYAFEEDRYCGVPWYTTKMVEVYRRQARI